MSDILHASFFILIAGSIFVALILFERYYLIKKNRSDAYETKEIFTNLTMGFLYKMIDGVVVALFVSQFYDIVASHGLNVAPNDMWLNAIVLFFVTDLLFYILHLGMHKIRYGWASHASHHSSLRFNLSTALRQNFLFDISGLALLWWIPMALIGFDKMHVVIAIELNLFYQFFFHTEAIGKMPNWYEFIFNTPSHHRVHHGSNPDQIDKNNGGVLIIWDRLFGTFLSEENAGPIRYGINLRQPTTLNPLRLNLDEFILMCRDVWRYKTLSIFWKRPDWLPANKETVNQA